jgi:hypothetical protein
MWTFVHILYFGKKERFCNMAKIVKLGLGTRSGKLRRYWSLIHQMQKVYHPDKTIAWVRKQHKKKMKGLENDIDDVAWQNPSP